MWLGMASSSYSAEAQTAVMALLKSARIFSLDLEANVPPVTAVSVTSGLFTRPYVPYSFIPR